MCMNERGISVHDMPPFLGLSISFSFILYSFSQFFRHPFPYSFTFHRIICNQSFVFFNVSATFSDFFSLFDFILFYVFAIFPFSSMFQSHYSRFWFIGLVLFQRVYSVSINYEFDDHIYASQMQTRASVPLRQLLGGCVCVCVLKYCESIRKISRVIYANIMENFSKFDRMNRSKRWKCWIKKRTFNIGMTMRSHREFAYSSI